ncbi:mycofactocin biosynthesis peptidyl-dipeptidase MftE [Streptomyces sp. NPDC088350]|uniref:mycofactocin biosynthesis peptidyl-dipeptidase MftE n=1 Tax=Streptomyces sp. NPDC088350 TaxID=3365854 RepID=UPI00381532B1
MTAPLPERRAAAAELGRTVWPRVSERALVLVPVGSTEQHGPHLPLNTDSVIATEVARYAAGRLGTRVLLAPTIAYGASGEHAGFPGTVSIGHEALRLVLTETVRSLSLWAGRTVLVNGHGGNVPTLDTTVAQLRTEGHDVAWLSCDVPGGDAHAGRTETSLMLHFAPDDVRLAEAAPGDLRPLAELMPHLRARGVRALSPNGVLGDPTGADAEEGRVWAEAMVAATVRRITDWCPDSRGRLPASRTRTARP